ncbi:recombinase family protein [Carboxydochorda subterranea]|uniref:Recombinase family protein n=1 Tax=Carboxydichorda subterranea TaxID=3109565 RepID=A0ABZ1C1B0_9FIRM|nr:recombinase family protein [Limnochorda sp. L945t]WRP18812.1 recombinase family protein [Limnochorda sp. L945t]
MTAPSKLTPEHLARRAVVYVRQSTLEQVRFHRESQRRQYELAERARAMGFRDVEVIDEDLGRSGTTAAGRPGFQRLVAAVCLREVGAVFSLEASRLARNNRDWYHLVDLCGLTGTLLVDLDGVYDPRLLNDRLLLGLKGTMSEFELALFRQRALAALQAMAERGELLTTVPVGYVRTADNRCEKDPDRRVQHAIALVFTKFQEYGSIRQVLLWFRQEGLPLPRKRFGPEGWITEWVLPIYHTLHHILTNPTYAGAYAFGRTATHTQVVQGDAVRQRSRRLRAEEWAVLIRDHHEGYISWEAFERNQAMIEQNAARYGARVRGPAREGSSLLAGLLRCGRCGRKLQVTYSGTRGNVPRYHCRGAAINHGTDWCISFGGLAVDRGMEQAILRVLEPAALEAAVRAEAHQEAARKARRQALELALQQAEYEAQRVQRQYDAVEPENRLVAAELERRWNEALARVDALRRQVEVARYEEGKTADNGIAEKLASLAQDLPRVWADPRCDARLKKRIVRTLVEEIVADVDAQRSVVRLVVHWAGGAHSELEVRKPRTGQHRYRTDQHVVELVRQLAWVIPDRQIARVLNLLGHRTGHGNTWTQARVTSLRDSHGIPCFDPKHREGWVTLTQAAQALGVSPMSVRRLLASGALKGQQVVSYAPWLIRRDELQRAEVKEAIQAIRKRRRAPLPEHPTQQTLDLTRK